MQPQDEGPDSKAFSQQWWELDFSEYLEEEDAGFLTDPPLFILKYFADFPEQDL